MKIVKVSNFDNETVSDVLVAENIQNEIYVKLIAEALNQKFSGDHSDAYFRIVADDYVLYKWEP